MNPSKSVEEICGAIERYHLMSSKDLAAMRARWFRPERKDVADPEAFRKWLVLNQYLTEFVVKVLSGRKSDQLVLNQYRLVDQLISGPMAGAYLAIDPLDHRVAIEVLSASSAADKSLLSGFRQAAEKGTKVLHPNVGRILDSGEMHGLHYLVKEYAEGPTLEDILQRRGKLPYDQAARLMALALAGLDVLHSQGVPAGDLTADCILLAPSGKGSSKQRTVKILHAGVRRRLFDETAIGRSISIAREIPDELQLAASCTFQVVATGALNPAEDIFRLGCVFYRCVTGKTPFTEQEFLHPVRLAKPVRDVAPDVPEMLAQIIDEMIDPIPGKRPQKAAHIAKSLRVFLAADEQSREVKEEEHLAHPTDREPAPTADVQTLDEQEREEDADDEQAPTRRRPGKPAQPPREGVLGKVVELWNEIQANPRDFVFLASGAVGILLLIFIVQLLTGLPFIFIAGLITGGAISYGVEMLLRWRKQRDSELT